MPKFIAKLGDDAYIDWSTIVDSPVSLLKTRAEAVAAWTEERIARADEQGTSIIDPDYPHQTPEQIIAGNRAGQREATLTLAEILTEYADAASRKEGQT